MEPPGGGPCALGPHVPTCPCACVPRRSCVFARVCPCARTPLHGLSQLQLEFTASPPAGDHSQRKRRSRSAAADSESAAAAPFKFGRRQLKAPQAGVERAASSRFALFAGHGAQLASDSEPESEPALRTSCEHLTGQLPRPLILGVGPPPVSGSRCPMLDTCLYAHLSAFQHAA